MGHKTEAGNLRSGDWKLEDVRQPCFTILYSSHTAKLLPQQFCIYGRSIEKKHKLVMRPCRTRKCHCGIHHGHRNLLWQQSSQPSALLNEGHLYRLACFLPICKFTPPVQLHTFNLKTDTLQSAINSLITNEAPDPLLCLLSKFQPNHNY